MDDLRLAFKLKVTLLTLACSLFEALFMVYNGQA
jgi:hypothetical protein